MEGSCQPAHVCATTAQRAGSKASSIVGSVSSGSMEALRPDDLPSGWASVASKPPARRPGPNPQDQHRNWLVFEVMDTGARDSAMDTGEHHSGTPHAG